MSVESLQSIPSIFNFDGSEPECNGHSTDLTDICHEELEVDGKLFNANEIFIILIPAAGKHVKEIELKVRQIDVSENSDVGFEVEDNYSCQIKNA